MYLATMKVLSYSGAAKHKTCNASVAISCNNNCIVVNSKTLFRHAVAGGDMNEKL